MRSCGRHSCDRRRLWRFSLADYRLPADVWELLASHDPYFHIRTRVQAAALSQTAELEAFTDGGWLDLTLAARLRTLTGSGGALLRGDTSLPSHDDARRRRLLTAGIATPEAFFKSIGLDTDSIDRLPSRRREHVSLARHVQAAWSVSRSLGRA
jgi:hypothetical protein